MTPIAELPFYTFSRLAETMGVSLPVLYKIVNRGDGPRRMRFGSTWRVSPTAADEFFRALENPDGPEAEALREYNRALANPQTDAGRAVAAQVEKSRARAKAAVKRASKRFPADERAA